MGYYTNRTLAHVELDTTREISLDKREKQSDLMQEVDASPTLTQAADSSAAKDSRDEVVPDPLEPPAAVKGDSAAAGVPAPMVDVQSPIKPASVPRLDVKKDEKLLANLSDPALPPNSSDSDDSSDLSSHRTRLSVSASTRSKSAGPRRKLGRGPTAANYASTFGEKSILGKLNKTKSLIPYAVLEEPLASERSDRSDGSANRTKLGRGGFVSSARPSSRPSAASRSSGMNFYGATTISDAGKQKEMEMLMSNSESLLGFYKHENQHRQYQFEKQRKRTFIRQTCFGLYRATAHCLAAGFSAWALILIAGKRSRVVITAQLLGKAVGTKMKFKELMLLYRRKAKAKGWNWWKLFMLHFQTRKVDDARAAARCMDMFQQATTRLKSVGMRYWRRACYDHEMQKTM
jgi:hypothetical protein